MRVEPEEKIINRGEVKEVLRLKTERITRIVALIVAFISVFFFIIKIMFL
jgi:preprotein translocase subunit SecE